MANDAFLAGNTTLFLLDGDALLLLQSLLSPPATNIQPLPEYKSSVAKKPRWVLSHYGVKKTAWDVIVLMCTIYVAIVVPYNAAFQVRLRACVDTQTSAQTWAAATATAAASSRLTPPPPANHINRPLKGNDMSFDHGSRT